MPGKMVSAIVKSGAPSLVAKATLFKDVFGFVIDKVGDKVGELTVMGAKNHNRSVQDRNRSLECQLEALRGQHKNAHLSVQCHTRGLEHQLERLRGHYKTLQTQSYILLGTCVVLFIRIGLGW